MSHGHITRASRRYPRVQRRSTRYGYTPFGHRPRGLPPLLLPAVTGRDKGAGINWVRLFLLSVPLAVLSLALVVGTVVAITASSVGATVAAYREVNDNLPSATLSVVDTFQSARIVDRNGRLLQEVADPETGWRTFVPLDQVNQTMIDATVAAEDATFWTHHGIEPFAIARAAMINMSGSGSSGASTITQQLVRAVYPVDIGIEHSYTRKTREALAAVEIERQFTKHDIMTMYLNQIYYGERSYGIEAAAQTYFAKHASELTLAEASLLAGLPQAPSAYNPTVNFERAKQRQRYVLAQMVKYHYITPEEAEEAFSEPLQPQTRSGVIQHAPHFVNYVHEYVTQLYGEDTLYRGGLTITTTIDIDLQDRAQQIVMDHVNDLVAYNAHNGAMIVMIPWSGEILAMVGSANFNDPMIHGQVNVAVAERQPGSAIKPITYAAAFEAGWSPSTVIRDERFRVETPLADQPFYEPQNYTGQFYGRVTIREALANSLNIPAVKALDRVGIEHFLDLSHRMGIKDGLHRGPDVYGLALTLGGGEVELLELTNVYATFANNGKYAPANPILKIEDGQGNVLYDLDREHAIDWAEQVLRAEYAYYINDIMSDDAARQMIFGRGNLFEQTADALGRPTAAKSGTTNDWRDNWTLGYTTDVAVGVWVGNSDNTPLAQIDGIQGAGPIWSEMMIELHENRDFAALLAGPDGRSLPEEFPRPPGVRDNQLDCDTNARGSRRCGSPAA